MVFVRAKTIKGRRYAYLAENNWVKGKVVQKTKKYLGPIISLPVPENNISSCKLDSEKSIRYNIETCVRSELQRHGFVVSNRSNNVLWHGEVRVHLTTSSITYKGKPAVIAINGRYLHNSLLRSLLSFHEVDNGSSPGSVLAKAFSDAGINIHPETFIALYKIIYA